MASDSFFTLTFVERVGLATLSLTMLMLLSAIVWLLVAKLGWFATISIVPLYWLFLWVAPQIYYLYYIAIFDGLPWQWVIGAALTPSRFVEIITFQARSTLSETSQGIGFWCVLGSGLISQYRRAA